jgi:cation diffusion facilitator family transporter
MQSNESPCWAHAHDFAGEFAAAEKNTRRVLWLTAAMMVIEITAGLKFRSMALFADGCHMGTHVAAFAISAGAYWLARRNAGNDRYTFGTGKIGVLGAYTSAIILGLIALYMFGESALRLVHPQPIAFAEAIPIACLGLVVNVVSAIFLGHGHDHHHGHSHDHDHAHGHGHEPEDLNLRAAYVHVIADAVTSLLAITALSLGKLFGWTWLDPVCGIAGSIVIAQWSWSLIASTQIILLDYEPETSDLREEIRKAFGNCKDTRICDLHIWQMGPQCYSAIISIVTAHPEPPGFYKQMLAEHDELRHVTIEVNASPDISCPPGARTTAAAGQTSAIAPAASGMDAGSA